MKALTPSLLIVISLYLFIHEVKIANTAPGSLIHSSNHRTRPRTFVRLPTRTIVAQYPRIKTDINDNFIADDEDMFEMSKRQTADDYGHMRFGKRDEMFDDYGHMRFGRNGEKK